VERRYCDGAARGVEFDGDSVRERHDGSTHKHIRCSGRKIGLEKSLDPDTNDVHDLDTRMVELSEFDPTLS